MRLPGEKEIIESFNQDTLEIYQYDEVLDIHIEKVYDDISGTYLYKGHLVITDGCNKIKIEMTNIRGDFCFYLGDHLEGFSIDDCSDRGYEVENKYHLCDYENSNNLNIYCEDLFLELLN